MSIKKIFWSFGLLLILSCSSEQDAVLLVRTNSQIEKRTRSLSEALEIAKESIKILENGEITRSAGMNRKVDSDCSYVISSRNTRNAASVADTLLYIINFDSDMGYAVISGKTNTEGLLAITESGHYSPNEKMEIEGMTDFISLAQDYVSAAIAPRPPITPINRTDTLHYYCGPFIQLTWGQRGVTSKYCPNNIAGCVPIAVAQIMSFYEYPSDVSITYQNADVQTQHLDWGEIKKHKLEFPQLPEVCSANDSAHNTLGRLCRQLGEMMHSYYDTEGTGTISSLYTKPCFEYLGYNTKDWQDYQTGRSKYPLDNGHALFFSGRRLTENGSTSGHAWVVDGYYDMTIRTLPNHTADGSTEYAESSITKHYNHINWGWDGSSNGYFLDNVFDTSMRLNNTINIYPDASNPRNYNINVQYLEVYR